MSAARVVRRLRNARRVVEIQRVLLKYGLAPLVTRLGPSRLWSRLRGAPQAPEPGQALPERLRLAIQELGPTAIKLGQMLSTRHDLVPPLYIHELQKLQDEVPPFPFEQVREQLERDLGTPPSQLFREIVPEPLASASIGQVHQATLLSGERVALKIQRPGVERIVERDLSILLDFAEFLQSRPRIARHYEPIQIWREFADGLRDQLSYTVEAGNAEQLAARLSEEPTAHFPRVYWGLTTRRTLGLELLEGIKIHRTEELCAAGYDLRQLAHDLVNLTLRQILIEGVFHADPHAGNFIVLPGPKIGVVDFGTVGRFDPVTRSRIADVFMGVVQQDASRVIEALDQLGFTTEETALEPFRRDLVRVLGRYLSLPGQEFKLGELLRRLMTLMYEHSIRVPTEFTLMAETLMMVEGTARELDPDFRILDVVEPTAWRVIGARLDPTHLARDVAAGARQLAEMARNLPRQVNSLLSQAEKGELKIRTEVHRVEHIMDRASTQINRLAFSIMVSAVTLASALLLQQARDFPFRTTLGLIGFVTSVAMAFWLLISILRSGRL